MKVNKSKRLIIILTILLVILGLIIPISYYIYYSSLPTWVIVDENKEAENLTSYNDISKDTNMHICINLEPISNSSRYNALDYDSIGLSLSINIKENKKYIPVPKIEIDKFILIDSEKNDTIKFVYIHNYFINDFKQITPFLQSLERKDSIEAASEEFWRERKFIKRSYYLEFMTNRKIKDVKHLTLYFKCRINGIAYEFNNSKFKVKKNTMFITPH